jgi:NADH-quinone oxidoreductase subunit K
VTDAALLAADPGQVSVGSVGSIPVSWFLIVAAILFVLGAIGVMIRHNPVVVLVCIELMLNAVNLTLVAFSRQLQNLDGQLFALMVIVVAAAEAVVGLAILVDIYRVRDLDDVDDLNELKG